MKNNYVTDTMALVLRLERRKMGRKARAIYGEAESGKGSILIPAMVLAEIGYLSERHKIETNLTEVDIYCRNYPSVKVTLITEEIIHASFEIDDIPELHDRIIAGTAGVMKLVIITNDPMMVSSKYVSTVW